MVQRCWCCNVPTWLDAIEYYVIRVVVLDENHLGVTITYLELKVAKNWEITKQGLIKGVYRSLDMESFQELYVQRSWQ